MIYLDNHATTPCDPRVIEAMLPYFSERFANPSSEIHRMGRDARQAVEKARSQVANLIGAEPEEIFFTSSATESNNLAILGVVRAHPNTSRKAIVTLPIEHKSVLAPCQALAKEGYVLVLLNVDNCGCVTHQIARDGVASDSLIVSIQAANNEIGTIQNIRTLAEITHEMEAIFHCDAAQAVGKIPVNVNDWGVDLLSISAHKMYGPKGVAALYVRGGPSHSPIAPIMHGGDQESGFRPGTLNVPSIIGFGEACRIAMEGMADESKRVAAMRDCLEAELLRAIPGLKRNGDLVNRLPNNSSLTFPGVDAEALIMSMPELALSTGSACNSGAQEPSYVLKTVGLSHDDANSTLRIGLGRFNVDSDVSTTVAMLLDALQKIGG